MMRQALLLTLSCLPAIAAAEIVYPHSDRFETPPRAVSAEHKPACAAASRYVDRINAGQYSKLSELFSETAEFLTPSGEVLHGRAAIDRFYSNFLGKLRPKVIPLSFIAEGQECVMELAAAPGTDEGHFILSAVDHFTIDDAGKILHMVGYVRPGYFRPEAQNHPDQPAK
jgi:SnoaL-like domain